MNITVKIKLIRSYILFSKSNKLSNINTMQSAVCYKQLFFLLWRNKHSYVTGSEGRRGSEWWERIGGVASPRSKVGSVLRNGKVPKPKNTQTADKQQLSWWVCMKVLIKLIVCNVLYYKLDIFFTTDVDL